MKENSLRVEVQLVYQFDKVQSVNYYCKKIVQVIIQQREREFKKQSPYKSYKHIKYIIIQRRSYGEILQRDPTERSTHEPKIMTYSSFFLNNRCKQVVECNIFQNLFKQRCIKRLASGV